MNYGYIPKKTSKRGFYKVIINLKIEQYNLLNS